MDQALTDRVRQLTEGGARAHQHEILVEETTNVLAAAEAGLAIRHLFVGEEGPTQLFAERLGAEPPTTVLTGAERAELFPRTRMPRVFAIVELPAANRFRDFAARDGDIVVLDGLDGPGNIGSVLRSAVAFGAGGVVLLDETRLGVYRRGIIRASAGAIFKIPIVTATVAQLAKFCSASGTALVATSSHAAGDFDSVVAGPGRLALALGSETDGCRSELLAQAAVTIRIPMSDQVESLNVSAAASVLLFARQPALQPAARPKTAGQGDVTAPS